MLLGGDFNQLDVAEITLQTGLFPLVNIPTQGIKRLDMLMSMPPQRHTIKVVEPTARSNHRAIIASTRVQCARVKLSEKRIFRRSTPSQVLHIYAALLNHLRNYDSSALTSTADPERAWELFYDTINGWLNLFYPFHQVTITSKDPAYITPVVKYLLRRKNHLMRSGRM